MILDARGGRGLGHIRTKLPLDREKQKVLKIPVITRDSGDPPQSATITLTLHIADVNDNPMYPGSKHVVVNSVKVSIKIILNNFFY